MSLFANVKNTFLNFLPGLGLTKEEKFLLKFINSDLRTSYSEIKKNEGAFEEYLNIYETLMTLIKHETYHKDIFQPTRWNRKTSYDKETQYKQLNHYLTIVLDHRLNIQEKDLLINKLIDFKDNNGVKVVVSNDIVEQVDDYLFDSINLLNKLKSESNKPSTNEYENPIPEGDVPDIELLINEDIDKLTKLRNLFLKHINNFDEFSQDYFELKRVYEEDANIIKSSIDRIDKIAEGLGNKFFSWTWEQLKKHKKKTLGFFTVIIFIIVSYLSIRTLKKSFKKPSIVENKKIELVETNKIVMPPANLNKKTTDASAIHGELIYDSEIKIYFNNGFKAFSDGKELTIKKINSGFYDIEGNRYLLNSKQGYLMTKSTFKGHNCYELNSNSYFFGDFVIVTNNKKGIILIGSKPYDLKLTKKVMNLKIKL